MRQGEPGVPNAQGIFGKNFFVLATHTEVQMWILQQKNLRLRFTQNRK
jgi:hypothetical protein